MMRDWTPDGALAEFERTTIELPGEDDGTLVATVVRRVGEAKSDKAFLYLHGFVDYFFHEHVASALIAAGWDVYALELRRYGRSLRAGNRPNYCTSLAQYDTEISAAIAIAADEDQHTTLVLYGHSTGGLIASLYADSGARRADISAVVLNSPFFGFKVNNLEAVKLGIGVAIGRVLPWLSDSKAISPMYGESIHATARGEWNFDLRWKPIAGFPAYFGWVRAIKLGHRRVQRGLALQCPVLVLHSDQSGGGREWNDNFHSRDIVLNVDHMRRFSSGLGRDVQREEVPGAIHDVMLSRQPVRERALGSMLNWLQRLPLPPAPAEHARSHVVSRTPNAATPDAS
ncbi:MAG: alpha/beta hydrolase [Phycisphaerae bacterium]|nr:alpha/beta hydrolase [Gemmatimonadaceae bacterium]